MFTLKSSSFFLKKISFVVLKKSGKERGKITYLSCLSSTNYTSGRYNGGEEEVSTYKCILNDKEKGIVGCSYPATPNKLMDLGY